MKQGKFYMRILTLVFFAAVLVYLVNAVTSAITDPLTTTLAISYEASEYVVAEGVVIRNEKLLYSDYAVTQSMLTDGEKAASGEMLAIGYKTAADAQSQASLDQITRRLEQLQVVYDTQLTPAQAAQLDVQIGQDVAAMNAAAAAGSWDEAAGLGWQVQTDILQRGRDETDAAEIAAQIESLTEQKLSLSQTGATGTVLRASEAGWYASGADGYETMLTPDSALVLTTQDLASLSESGTDISGVYGRLITDEIWYFAASMDYDEARQAMAMQTVRVDFSGESDLSADMRVVQVGLPDNDNRSVVVFSCDRYINQVINLRFAEVGIAFSTCSGLRIPKDAIRLEEISEADTDQAQQSEENTASGEVTESNESSAQNQSKQYRTGVYVIESGRARFKEVEILLDTGSAYVVKEDDSSTANLWAGDEVIVSARNLFDGKVVR